MEAERLVQLAVDGRLEFFDIDSQLVNQVPGDGAVRRGTLNGERASITEEHPSGLLKFVALGMTAEVIVIIKD